MADCDAKEDDESVTLGWILSVLVFQQRVGVAAYNADVCQVSCSETPVALGRMEEVPIRSVMDVPGDMLWLVRLLYVKRPRVVLVPSAGCQVILDIALLCGVEALLTAPCEFDDVRVWDLLDGLWTNMSRMRWHSRICPHRHVMLMALSALLPYLGRCESPVADIVEVPPMGLLYVDEDTLASLQLIRTELHPMDFQGIGRAKEGLSLLSVVDRTCSVLGRLLLRQWFSLPLRDEVELRRRYDVVSFFTLQGNHEMLLQLRRSLRKLRHPGGIFTKMRAAKHTTSDYESLLGSVRSFLRIASLLTPQAHTLPLFLCIVASCQTSQLEEMSRIIDEGISFSKDCGETLSKTYVRIRSGCDATLDELRAHYARIDDILTRVAQEESGCVPSGWGACTLFCVFAPPWGYVITVPRLPQLVMRNEMPLGWELLLQSDEGPFFKTPMTRRLDEDVGDLRSAILERESEIQQRLDSRLLELSPALIPLHNCAELDCLIGFALCALEGHWSRPEILQKPGVLEIDRGVHPILSRTTAHQTVPYSLSIRRSSQRICVVTGANGSGKSVFITAVAHTVFLAHIGSFVPCVHATIGLVNTLMSLHSAASLGSRKRDMTSVAKEIHSSFGNELVSMSRMLHRCSSRDKEDGAGAGCSLLVLDEFGKGTLSMDGAALLAASIGSFISLGERRPIVLLATHYTDIIQPQVVPLEEIQLLEMLTALTAFQENRPTMDEKDRCDEFVIDDQQLVHLFRVTPAERSERSHKQGITSHALRFALQFSVPTFLLQRAWNLILTGEV